MEHITGDHAEPRQRRHTTGRLKSAPFSETAPGVAATYMQLSQAIQAMQDQRQERRQQMAQSCDPILLGRLEHKLSDIEQKLNTLAAIKRTADQGVAHGVQKLEGLRPLIDQAMSGRGDGEAIAREAERRMREAPLG